MIVARVRCPLADFPLLFKVYRSKRTLVCDGILPDCIYRVGSGEKDSKKIEKVKGDAHFFAFSDASRIKTGIPSYRFTGDACVSDRGIAFVFRIPNEIPITVNFFFRCFSDTRFFDGNVAMFSGTHGD